MTAPIDQQPDPRLRFLHMELKESTPGSPRTSWRLGAHTWAIRGSIPVDGEVLMAEFDAQEEAVTVLRELFGPEHLPPAS